MTRSARFVARVPGAIEPHFLRAQLVSGNYFSTLRVPAARGRILVTADVDTAAPVAVVSDGYWRPRLGADDGAVGRTIVVNGVSVTVAGITAPGFFGICADTDADIWLPLTLQAALHYENNPSGYADLEPDAPWPAQDAIAWLNVVARRAGTDVTLHDNWVSADYFATSGLRILSGRSFDDQDSERRPRVVIVNESAQRYFRDRKALGQRLGSSQPDTEVIGVIRDARTQTLHDEPIPMVYFPLEQRIGELQTAPTNMDIRVATDAATAVPAIRAAIKRAEPDLLLDAVASKSVRLERDLNRERLVAWLAFSFGVLALRLASIGLYGVLSYNVARRTQEIGFRMALGARRIVVMRSVLGQSGRLTVTGLVIGLLGASAGSEYLSGLLYGVTPTDPFVLAAVGAVFIVVTTVAAYVPARRATRVDPLDALRSD